MQLENILNKTIIERFSRNNIEKKMKNNYFSKTNSINKSESTKEWPNHVIVLEVKNIDKFIKKFPFVIIDFWAPWCAPCKAMAPRLRRLAQIFKRKIAIGKIDTQKNQDINKKYKIQSIPQLILFKNGKKVHIINGLKSVGYIKNIIENELTK